MDKRKIAWWLLSGNGFSDPTVQASAVVFTAKTDTTLTFNWTNGNGTSRIVLMKAGGAVNSDPVDGNTYTANSVFGSGSQIGTGNYVVKIGSGPVTVTGLTASTTYHVAVYEFNTNMYLTTSPAIGNDYTWHAKMQGVISRWTALTYTAPTTAVQIALNTLLNDLTGYGVLSGMDGLWVPMLNDNTLVSTTGAINFITPSANQWTFPVAPTYTASGVEGDAISKYVLTNFNPSTHGVQHTLNSSSRGMLVYKAKTAVISYFDGHAASAFNIITGNTAGSTLQRVHGNSIGPSPVFDNTGYIAVNRSGSANGEVYKETTRTTGTGTSISVPNENYTVLRSSSGYGDMGIAIYYLGRSFSQTEHGNIRTAFLAYKTALGL